MMEGMESNVGFTSCSGSAWTSSDKSTLHTQHVLAGVALLVWSLHWIAGSYRAYLLQSRGRPFSSRTTYSVPWIPSKIPLEALLKTLTPPLVMLGQLYGISKGLRSNVCPAGSARPGRFDPDNIFRYANVWIQFSFMLSGVVDLVSIPVQLPAGMQRFFLAVPFIIQTLILASGQHLDMLDDMVYYMLFLVSAGVSAFIVMEIVWPHSFLVSCGRSYCSFLLAIWFFGIARILYEGRPAWSTTEPLPDMSPAMFVPVPFVFWMNFTSVFMIVAYLVMRRLLKASLPSERASNGDGEVLGLISKAGRALGMSAIGKDADASGHELMPLVR